MAEELSPEEAFANALQAKEDEQPEQVEQEYDPLLNEQDDDEDGDEVYEEVDEDESEEADGEEPAVEGPSDEMRAVAKLAGVPEQFLGMAKTNADVQMLISHFSQKPEEQKPQAQQEAPVEEDLELSVEDFLPSDDFDESDPAHKAVKSLVDVLNEERKTTRLLLGFASQQMNQQQQEQARAFQSPFDEALDEIGAFGDSKSGLSDSEVQMRKAAFQAYISLAEGEPPERRKELAQAAARVKFSHLLPKEEAVDKKKALMKQSRRRRGAGVTNAPPAKLSAVDEFEKRLLALANK